MKKHNIHTDNSYGIQQEPVISVTRMKLNLELSELTFLLNLNKSMLERTIHLTDEIESSLEDLNQKISLRLIEIQQLMKEAR